MEIVDNNIQDFNDIDQFVEDMVNWPDMLSSDYVYELLFVDNAGLKKDETHRIFHKHYAGSENENL